MPGTWALTRRGRLMWTLHTWLVAGLIAGLTAAAWAAPAPRREGEFNTAAPTAILI